MTPPAVVHNICQALLAFVLLLGGQWPLPCTAQDTQTVPTFSARYDVRVNGFKLAQATFSLIKADDDTFLYQQRTQAVGVAGWFRKEEILESSRWRLTGQGIQPLEYRYSRSGGSDDRKVQLIFDWQAGKVENRVAGQPWTMAIPAGTLDKLLVQIALLLELRQGKTRFDYAVADGGRLKHFEFEVVGEETVELPNGVYRTVKLARLDDEHDRTWIWAAPALDYLPVRFLKKKKNGLRYEIRLRDIDDRPVAGQGS